MSVDVEKELLLSETEDDAFEDRSLPSFFIYKYVPGNYYPMRA